MSFTKAKRFVEFPVDQSPGPSQYDVNLDSIKKGPIQYKICNSPRFPEKCGTKRHGRECTKCSNADLLSSMCPRHSCYRSFNSSLNSSTENINKRFLVPTEMDSYRPLGHQNLSEIRQDLEDLRVEQPLSRSEIVRSFNNGLNNSEELSMAPFCMYLTDSTDTEDEQQENVNSKLNLTVQNTQSYQLSSSIAGSGSKFYPQPPDHRPLMDTNSRASSADSDILSHEEDSSPSTESYTMEEMNCTNSPDFCKFALDGKLCELCRERRVTSNILKLQKMMAIHRMEMRKMHDLIDDLSRTLEEMHTHS